MSRPRKNRKIDKDAEYTCFKPLWVPRSRIEKVELFIDEYEAMRLVDLECYSMSEWAEKMWISSSTFYRLVESAHKKVADAIVNWKWIKVYNKLQ